MNNMLLKEILSEVKTIKSDANDMKIELTDIKHDVNDIILEVTELKGDVSTLKSEFINTNKRLDNIESKQETIYQHTAKLTESHTEIRTMLKNLATKEDLEYLDKKLGEHDREIFKIKNKM